MAIGAPSQYKDGFAGYGDSHNNDNTVARPSYLENGDSCTAKTAPEVLSYSLLVRHEQ